MSVDFYIEHVRGIIDEVKFDLSKLESVKSDSRIPLIDQMLEKIKGANDSLDEIQHGMVYVATNEKQNVARTLQQLRNDIDSLENRLTTNRQRTQLMAGASSAPNLSVQDSLLEISQTMSESQSIGNGILTQLSNQRNKLLHAHGNVHEIDDTVSKASQVVARMIQRANQNKMIAYGCVALLVLGILLILYLWF